MNRLILIIVLSICISANEIEGCVEETVDIPSVRSLISFNASWMFGDILYQSGISLMCGIESKKKHLYAINYDWGFNELGTNTNRDVIYGGGFLYMYSFNVNDVFITRIGGSTGFWLAKNHYKKYNTYFWNDSYYFGGPKVRFEIGYKNFHIVIVDAALLTGSITDFSPISILNSGIVWSFK